jgi:hypothetical protein
MSMPALATLISVPGGRLWLSVDGPADRIPLTLIHAGVATSEMWDVLAWNAGVTRTTSMAAGTVSRSRSSLVPRAALSEVKVPALICWGDLDESAAQAAGP